MEDIIKLINNNPNIPFELKHKLAECVNLILENYKCAYRNLYINLENIHIYYINKANKHVLKNKNANSLYDPINNIMYLDYNIINKLYHKNLLVHELLHVASNKEYEFGFETIQGRYSKSLNEGYTELLTRRICKDSNYGITKYDNDINNILFFVNLLGERDVENNYFNGKIYNLFSKYFDTVGTNNHLGKIMISMEKEYEERVIKDNFENPYKDKYIVELMKDISRLKFDDEILLIGFISYVSSFIRGQYKTEVIPEQIKFIVEKAFNILISKNKVMENDKKTY